MNVNTTPTTAKVPLVGDDHQIDWTRIDTPVEYKGKKIVLPGEPGEMPLESAIVALEQIKEAEAQEYDTAELVAGLPWDSAVAVFRALQEIYGIILPKTVMTWFGPRNPTFETIKTGPGDMDAVQVPMGKITLPGMKNEINVRLTRGGCVLAGSVNKRDRARLLEIAMRARVIVRTDSIYKGKAIELNVDDDGDLDLSSQPAFFELEGVKESDIIHNDMTANIIRTSIFAPIKHTQSCRKHGIPLKRGILLEGKYGCGKSLTARITAKIAQDNGWTFIVLARAQGLRAALNVANSYQPCVVFAEDIDRFGDRTKEEVNDLVNLMDGLVPKGSAVMTILTTNHIELIDKALLRPGRLDAVISIDAPDAKTVERLIVHYGGSNLPEGTPLEAVGLALAGQIPATIAEVVKRAKLAMLTEDREILSESDLVTAAESATRHMALLADMPAEKSKGDQLAELLKGISEDGTDKMAESLAEHFKELIAAVS